jgi:hypothetical protein
MGKAKQFAEKAVIWNGPARAAEALLERYGGGTGTGNSDQ